MIYPIIMCMHQVSKFDATSQVQLWEQAQREGFAGIVAGVGGEPTLQKIWKKEHNAFLYAMKIGRWVDSPPQNSAATSVTSARPELPPKPVFRPVPIGMASQIPAPITPAKRKAVE
jgi:hypothetical protein